MTFEIWEFSESVSRCIAKRQANDVQSRFHNMRIGEQRYIGDACYIVRVT